MSGLRFFSMGSGSDGNWYYLGTEHYGILIDAGLSYKRIIKRLKDKKIDISDIYGIILTHGHADHVRGAKTISEKNHTPFYATKETFNLISTGYRSIYNINSTDQKEINEFETFEIGEFKIKAFPVKHDVPTVGFVIEARGLFITIATDLGEGSEFLNKSIKESDYLVIEANYDKEMLLKGTYPAALKNRIISNSGHLCNEQTSDIIKQFASDKLKKIFICHMSAHNNTTEAVKNSLNDCLPAHTQMIILPRQEPTMLIEL